MVQRLRIRLPMEGTQPEEIQQQIVRETFHLVLKRDDNICNFLEGGSLIGGSDYKLIYRHYATLYFVFCVDSSESELGILDLIQVFVETLDKCFENVCELDLIFHMDKVHYILQEVVMGGMVLETNMNEIVAQIEAQNRLEKSEGGLSAAPARAEPSQPCSTTRSTPSRSPALGPGPHCPGAGKSPVSTASLLTRAALPISRTDGNCGCEGPWLPQWGSGAQVIRPLSLPCAATPRAWGL
uniref:AP complex mu/sigma subunit domain-containing protein n=1 Tax=Capra hircus TaxID=9925 RepID=A0A8C2PCV2_CAPHI